MKNGVKINRHLLIKYIANKLGGTHFDVARDASSEEGQKYLLLDKARD